MCIGIVRSIYYKVALDKTDKILWAHILVQMHWNDETYGNYRAFCQNILFLANYFLLNLASKIKEIRLSSQYYWRVWITWIDRFSRKIPFRRYMHSST